MDRGSGSARQKKFGMTILLKNYQQFLFSSLFLFYFICPSLHADSPLGTKMNQMRKSFRGLKKAMVTTVDADKQKHLSWVADLKSAA